MTTDTLEAPVAGRPLTIAELRLGEILMIPAWMLQRPHDLQGWVPVRVTVLPGHHADAATRKWAAAEPVLVQKYGYVRLGEDDNLREMYEGRFIQRPTPADAAAIRAAVAEVRALHAEHVSGIERADAMFVQLQLYAAKG